MVKFSVLQLTHEDKDLWNEFVDINPYAHFYHLWEWGDIQCRTYANFRYYLAIKCGDDLVGILPLLLIKSSINKPISIPNKLVSLPFCEYGGPLVQDSSDLRQIKPALMRLSKTVIRLARRLSVDYIELRHPMKILSSDLSCSGFIASRRNVTFRIDLTKCESELWRNLKKDARNPIRRATKAGVKIKEVKADRVRQYYSLYLGAQKRHGSPPHSYTFFMNVYNAFRRKGLLQMFFATYDNRPIGGIMIFCFNGKTYDWNAVTDPKYRKLNPNNLLIWHVIKWARENNFKVLDLGRTRRETKGLYHFKRGWGGREMNLEDYLFFIRDVGIPNPAQMKYTYLSKLWSLLPVALTQRIGPKIVAEIGL